MHLKIEMLRNFEFLQKKLFLPFQDPFIVSLLIASPPVFRRPIARTSDPAWAYFSILFTITV